MSLTITLGGRDGITLQMVGVDGRLNWREWEDKQTGQKRSAVDIIADSVQFLGSRGEGEGGQYIPSSDVNADQSDFVKSGAAADDDIPF